MIPESVWTHGRRFERRMWANQRTVEIWVHRRDERGYAENSRRLLRIFLDRELQSPFRVHSSELEGLMNGQRV
jgi:hypothetical protein